MIQRFYPLQWLMLVACLCLTTFGSAANAETARGVVFDDRNANSVRDAGEPGLPGVRVSNGVEIVATDDAGRYAIEIDDDAIVFVLKPRDWRTRFDAQHMPRFYYIHKPAGSPDEGYQYPGVEPTGPLPASIDFPLIASPEPDEFTVIVMGDPQPATRQEVRFYANDVIAELIDTDAALGLSMGDIVGDNLSLFESVNAVQALVGVPWYNVLGNHDINYDSPNDEYSNESFERVYGPPNYAFQYGHVHFVVLDNVQWDGRERKDERGRTIGGYRGAFSDGQLEFVANYMRDVPKDERVIVCTHIPLPEIDVAWDRKKHSTPQFKRLLETLSGHPHTMSFSAHSHFNHHAFAGRSEGYTAEDGAEHHHHNVATGSGSWYRGPLDEQGFPVTTMSDGAPNGYILATFRGNEYRLRYKAARLPAEYQMAIHTSEVVASECSEQSEVVANVFNGTERSQVRMRVRGHGDWIAMRNSPRRDPLFQAAHERDVAAAGETRKPLPEAATTWHIWAAPLPAGLPPGMYILEVEATDMFGQTDLGKRILDVQ